MVHCAIVSRLPLRRRHVAGVKAAAFAIALLSVPMFALHWTYMRTGTLAAEVQGYNVSHGFALGEQVYGVQPETVSCG